MRSGAEGPRRPVDVGFGPTEDGTWRSQVAGETAGSNPVTSTNDKQRKLRGLRSFLFYLHM